MPPTNSRASSPLPDSSTQPGTTPSLDSLLRPLESPVSSSVLNIASTLTTSPDEDDDDGAAAENLRFLRLPPDPQDEWRAENARERLRQARDARGGGDRERRERLQRVLNRLSRLQDTSAAYGDRTPSQNHLYDWSPADAGGNAANAASAAAIRGRPDDDEELEQILRELRQMQPNAPPEILRQLGRAQLTAERDSRESVFGERAREGDHHGLAEADPLDPALVRERREQNVMLRQRQREAALRARQQDGDHTAAPTEAAQQEPAPTGGASLRSAAILQSVRRHPRFSARSREYMQRYITQRERAMQENETAGRGAGAHRPQQERTAAVSRTGQAREALPQPPLAQQRVADLQIGLDRVRGLERDIRARIESYRRDYPDSSLNVPPATATTTSTITNADTTSTVWLEQVISYMSALRSSNSLEESLGYAVEHGLVSRDTLEVDRDDFVLDLATVPGPTETSWLVPGAVLSGSQHATQPLSGSADAWRSRAADNLRWPTFDGGGGSGGGAGRGGGRPRSRVDRWPVKVTLHTVDYESMTLCATMEAYNVPSHPPMHVSLLNPGSSSAGISGGGNNSNYYYYYNDDASTTDYDYMSSASSSARTTPVPPSPSRHNNNSSSNDPAAASTPRRTPITTRTNDSPRHHHHHRLPPATSGPTRTSSITTYLEGEIIDLSAHALLTESFASTLATDAAHWRRLPPLSAFSSDAAAARALCSRAFLADLAREWVLMRWKERCFVRWAGPIRPRRGPEAPREGDPARGSNGADEGGPAPDAEPGRDTGPDPDGCGLTISGFYFVALRRADGRLEGLYFDPQSSPYQCLRLASGALGGPAACEAADPRGGGSPARGSLAGGAWGAGWGCTGGCTEAAAAGRRGGGSAAEGGKGGKAGEWCCCCCGGGGGGGVRVPVWRFR